MPDTEADCRLVREVLLGDTGRAWKPCPTCGGRGDIDKDEGITTCDECEEGRVWDQERLAKAVWGFAHFGMHEFDPGGYGVNGWDAAMLTNWDHRHGQPWESALVEFAVAWREKAVWPTTEELLVRLVRVSSGAVRISGDIGLTAVAFTDYRSDIRPPFGVSDVEDETERLRLAVRAAALDYVRHAKGETADATL